MAQSRPRYTDYGAPLPELADARQEVLYDREQNQAQRRHLLHRLEQVAHELLRRGVFAEVRCEWKIENGIIQDPVDVSVTRHWRTE
jgi:hypothetical protein